MAYNYDMSGVIHLQQYSVEMSFNLQDAFLRIFDESQTPWFAGMQQNRNTDCS